jgi:hypothetical protein
VTPLVINPQKLQKERGPGDRPGVLRPREADGLLFSFVLR